MGAGLAAVLLVLSALGIGSDGEDSEISVDFDPDLGQNMTVPPKDFHGKPIRLGERNLILYAGKCGDCTVGAFEWKKLKLSGFDSVVAIYRAGDFEKLPKVSLSIPVHFVVDQRDRLRKEYNAYFFPRAYVIGKSGALEWLASKSGEYPTGLEFSGPRL